MFSTTRRYLRDERGIALVIVAASMVVVLSFAALAIDIGKLTTARTEAQRTADLAALAGAGNLVFAPKDATSARAVAIEYAGYNTVIGEAVTAGQLNVVVDLAALTVEATVNRTTASGSPVTTHFARVFGVNDVDITAYAKAQVFPVLGAKCLLPIALPDRWNEIGGDPEDFEPALGDIYVPHPSAGFTGYSDDDYGERVRIKEGKGPGTMNPSWYFPWRPPGQSGGADFRANIAGCVDPDLTYSIGQMVDAEPGNMIGPAKQGFADLIDKDPTAHWNGSANGGDGCVTSVGSNQCRGSDRIRPMPVFDPNQEPPNGSKPFPIANFLAVFVEQPVGNDYWVRIMTFVGAGDFGGNGGGGQPLGKAVRLVE